jgi:hypothetical protein
MKLSFRSKNYYEIPQDGKGHHKFDANIFPIQTYHNLAGHFSILFTLWIRLLDGLFGSMYSTFRPETNNKQESLSSDSFI